SSDVCSSDLRGRVILTTVAYDDNLMNDWAAHHRAQHPGDVGGLIVRGNDGGNLHGASTPLLPAPYGLGMAALIHSCTRPTAAPMGTRSSSRPSRLFSSTCSSSRDRGPMVMRSGKPSKSASLNFAPARSARSSNTTSTPASASD